jgi:hypothetical protein
LGECRFATKKVLVRRDGYRKAIESKDLVVGYHEAASQP